MTVSVSRPWPENDLRIDVVLRSYPVTTQTFHYHRLAAWAGQGCLGTVWVESKGDGHVDPRLASRFEPRLRYLGELPGPPARLLAAHRRLIREAATTACPGNGEGGTAGAIKQTLSGLRLGAHLQSIPSGSRSRPTILHAPFSTANLTIARAAGAAAGLPVSTEVHSPLSWYRNPSWFRTKVADAAVVAVISGYCGKRVVELSPEAASRIVEIHCGLPDNARQTQPSRARTSERAGLVSVGGLVDKKGHDTFVRAAKLLNLPGTVIGGGPLEGSLRHLAAELDAPIDFTGSLPNAEVWQRMKSSDVGVLAARRGAAGDEDGLPVVLLELLRLGLPVCSTTVAAIPDLLRTAGTLAVPDDEVALAAAIEAAVAAGPPAADRHSVPLSHFDTDTEATKLAEALYRATRPATDRSVTKPSLVWFKAQAPGIRRDGSSLVTLRFAEQLAHHYDLHLMCLRTPATVVDPATTGLAPFASVVMVDSPHQRSKLHRLVWGGWYQLLDRLGLRPLAVSIENSRPLRKALEQRVAAVGATAGIVEYWSAGRLVDLLPQGRSSLLLHDVEHLSPRYRGRRRRMVLEEELAACHRADRVIFVSPEDEEAFIELGVANGEAVLVPAASGPVERRARSRSTPAGTPGTAGAEGGRISTAVLPVVLFVGHLAWGPNHRGLAWFLDRVWPLVRQENPEVRLKVVGPGATEAFGPTDGVHFAGFVEDLDAELRAATVGVVPTLDGTGVRTKTIEFLAAGLPIVATANGVRGTSAEKAGAIITDEPADFADAVLRLLADGGARRRLVAEGRAHFERWHATDDLPQRLLP